MLAHVEVISECHFRRQNQAERATYIFFMICTFTFVLSLRMGETGTKEGTVTDLFIIILLLTYY